MSVNTGCIVDVETTGFSPYNDEIIEIALILFHFKKETGEVVETIREHSFLREPVSKIARDNYQATFRIHGIPFSEVKGKTMDDCIIKDIFSATEILIAHNASFDRSFIYQMYPEVNEKSWYCSMKNINWTEYGFCNKKLITLLQAHNITNMQSHRALEDTSFLLELLTRKNPNNITYFKELLSNGAMRKYQPNLSASTKKVKTNEIIFDISLLLQSKN